MFDKETKNCIIKSEAAEMPLCQDHGVGKFPALFAMATSQSPGLPETLATAYNPGMCLWALPVIKFYILNISFCSSH